ncbi:MAG: hypothetical protein HFG69_15620 [Hungatella sp.]|jgi:hypothetical protein|nr:hypothetical protein [Hungatella sp.]
MKKIIFYGGIIFAALMFMISIYLFKIGKLESGIATILGTVIGGVVSLMSKVIDGKSNEPGKPNRVGHTVKGKDNEIEGIEIQQAVNSNENIGHNISGDKNRVGGIKYER